MIDAVAQRVFQAFAANRAINAHALGLFDAHAVGGEELRGIRTPAPGTEHPLVVLAVIGGGDGLRLRALIRSFEIHVHRMKRSGPRFGSPFSQKLEG